MAKSFVIKLLKQYRETGGLAPKSSPGRPRELNEEQMKQVQALVEANPDATLDELRAGVAQTCGVMKRLRFTRKKALHPSDKASERVQWLRGEYWNEVRDVRVEDLVFIDESGVNLG